MTRLLILKMPTKSTWLNQYCFISNGVSESRTWELNAIAGDRELGVKEKMTATKFRIIVYETSNNAATTGHLIISSILSDRGTKLRREASFLRLNHQSNERLPTAMGINDNLRKQRP